MKPKKNGADIRETVEVLCDILAPQRAMFYQAVNNTPPDLINNMLTILSKTDANLARAMDW